MYNFDKNNFFGIHEIKCRLLQVSQSKNASISYENGILSSFYFNSRDFILL